MTSSRRKVGSQSKINTHTAATPPKATKKQQLTATPSLASPTISQPSLTPEMSSYQEMPSLTPENVAAILTELKELRTTVAQNQNKISILEKEIGYLKGHITITESKLAIAEHVSSTLHEQIDNQEQYSRRKCLIFEGIKVDQKEKDSDLEKRILSVIQKELKLNIEPEDIDKAHRIGPVEGDEQNIIIKFTKDSTASHIYQSRGKLKDSRANHKGVKIRTSLTKRRQNLLKYAREQAEDYEIIHFVFADVNGNLKLRLKEKVRNRMVFSFNNKTELAEIIGIIEHFEYSKLSQLIQQQRENSDGSDIDEF